MCVVFGPVSPCLFVLAGSFEADDVLRVVQVALDLLPEGFEVAVGEAAFLLKRLD